MRDTFSVLETGEVVAIGIARTGSGSSAQTDTWVWVDKGKRWAPAEQEYNPEIANQLREGMERYEEMLRADPRRAAQLRQRSDNTVDGQPNQAPDAATVEKAKVAAGADGSTPPRIEDPGEVPNILSAVG